MEHTDNIAGKSTPATGGADPTLSSKFNGKLWGFSLLGAIVGMLVGLIPLLISTNLTGSSYPILFAPIPLAMCFFIFKFRGYRCANSFYLIVLFTCIGFYLAESFVVAASYAKTYGGTFFSVYLGLLFDVRVLGRLDKESLYTYIILFFALWITWEIYPKHSLLSDEEESDESEYEYEYYEDGEELEEDEEYEYYYEDEDEE